MIVVYSFYCRDIRFYIYLTYFLTWTLTHFQIWNIHLSAKYRPIFLYTLIVRLTIQTDAILTDWPWKNISSLSAIAFCPRQLSNLPFFFVLHIRSYKLSHRNINSFVLSFQFKMRLGQFSNGRWPQKCKKCADNNNLTLISICMITVARNVYEHDIHIF